VIDHILPKTNVGGKNVIDHSKHSLGYHEVPSPIWNSYVSKKPDGFEKALNVELTTSPNYSKPCVHEFVDISFAKNENSFECESEVCINLPRMFFIIF